MNKKIWIPCCVVLFLAAVVAGLLLMPVKLSSPSSEVMIFSGEDELTVLKQDLESFYAQQRNSYPDEQLSPDAPVLSSEELEDYATVFLRADVKNFSLFKSRLVSAMLDEKNVKNDGVFLLKEGALWEREFTPLLFEREFGLTHLEIHIKGMTEEEIFNYVKTLRLEITVQSSIRSYTIPVDFADANVRYFEADG
jgi:hypothetical protein